MRRPAPLSALPALLALAAPAAAQTHDVPWFQANPRARAETLRRCSDDAALNRTPACANARAAETRSGRMGAPYPSEPTLWERELPDYLRQHMRRGQP